MEYDYKTPVEKILNIITTHPEEVRVEQSIDGTIVILKIYAHKDDYAVIIGKRGNTINAIKTILRIKAVKENVKLIVIVDPDSEKHEERRARMSENRHSDRSNSEHKSEQKTEDKSNDLSDFE